MAKCKNEKCNNEVVRKHARYCSRACSQACIVMFGQTKEAKEKRKQTCKERYGFEYAIQSNEVQDKVKQICKERYGVENVFQLKEVQEKARQTCKEKFGTEFALHLKEVQEKRIKTRLEIEYANLCFWLSLSEVVESLFSSEEYRGIRDAKGLIYYSWLCLLCGQNFNDHTENNHPKCKYCEPNKVTSSRYEDEIANWFGELNISNIVRNNTQIISHKGLDIYLPDYKLAIEFNGLYRHSEKAGGKDKNYHLDKTNQCEEKGIQLLHIFEDEWLNEQKQEMIKSIIKSKLGLIINRIYARKCEVKSVPNDEAKAFLFDNHLQTIVNCKHYFGLYHQDSLLYLIGISKPRFNKDYQYELVRSCPKINTNVIGGFSKLIKHAVKALSISTMISYVDRRYFIGKGYTGNWVLLRSVDPNYFYTKGYERESRVKYQRHKLETLFSTTYDSTLTEWEIMQLNGFDRIWDCGNLVFGLKNE